MRQGYRFTPAPRASVVMHPSPDQACDLRFYSWPGSRPRPCRNRYAGRSIRGMLANGQLAGSRAPSGRDSTQFGRLSMTHTWM